MSDGVRLSAIMSGYKPLAVIHAATSPGMTLSNSPRSAYDNIVIGTLNLLEAMRASQISMLCVMASAAIYGDSSALSLSEQAQVRPLTPYGASLAAIETMISDFSFVGDLRWASLRLFSAAGADPELDFGSRLEGDNRLLPIALDAATGHRSNVPVYGSHFLTRDGSALRDYVHVTDIADATMRSLEGLFSNRAAGPYNIGSGREYSVFEVLQCVERITGKKPSLRYEAKRPFEPPILSADISRAEQELLWTPKYSALATIVTTEWEYRKTLWQARSDAGLLGMRKIEPQQDPHRKSFGHEPADGNVIDLEHDTHEELLKKLDLFLEATQSSRES